MCNWLCCLILCVQGVLAKMEEQLRVLQEELALKDEKLDRLTSALDEVTSKVTKTEKCTGINSQRLGE